MKKSILPILTSIILLASCESLDNLVSQIVPSNSSNSTSDSVKIKQPRYTKDKVDSTIWDLSVLDTARNVEYLFEVEKNVILEMNMARSNPKKYAEMYIQPRTKRFNGNLYNDYFMTNEGVAVVNECIKFMNNQKPLPILNPSKGLSQAAKDHASTQCLTDQTGHTGTDGSDPFVRMKRYGTYTTAGENIAYGTTSAREIVVQLLIDDGVKSRGHRKNIMNKSFTTSGVGYADKHKTYGSECVITYSGTFTEKE
ncbi:MAG: CAP domain-containing protein [Treponema sp.]|nr:CAP domain-containing protein [Candidatus Treponema equifaecale]